MVRAIRRIIIHCSATPNGRPHTVQDIDAWHRSRGFLRTRAQNTELQSIGYHFVIYINGEIHPGRDISEIGAHAAGYNTDSIGICMIGTDCFYQRQWLSLSEITHILKKLYPAAEILGHRDLPKVAKLCPGFDVTTWRAQNMGILLAHCMDIPAPEAQLPETQEEEECLV